MQIWWQLHSIDLDLREDRRAVRRWFQSDHEMQRLPRHQSVRGLFLDAFSRVERSPHVHFHMQVFRVRMREFLQPQWKLVVHRWIYRFLCQQPRDHDRVSSLTSRFNNALVIGGRVNSGIFHYLSCLCKWVGCHEYLITKWWAPIQACLSAKLLSEDGSTVGRRWRMTSMAPCSNAVLRDLSLFMWMSKLNSSTNSWKKSNWSVLSFQKIHRNFIPSSPK